MKRNKNITLIGMTGVGKSTIGKRLARKLRFDFLDVDNLIVTQNSLKLQQIIDRFGEKEFLKKEEEAILSLREVSSTVIAPGGSSVYSQRAMKLLKEISFIVFLNSSYKSIKKRIRNLDIRGIVGLRKKGLERLYKERVPLYQRYADKIVDVPDNFNVNSIVVDIKSLFKESSQK